MVSSNLQYRAKNVSPYTNHSDYEKNIVLPENNTSENENIAPENMAILNGMKNIGSDNSAKSVSPLRSPSKTVGSVVRGFKIGVTKWMRQNTNVYKIWQRNYYEIIIRNEKADQNISNYIINNPQKWDEDKFYK